MWPEKRPYSALLRHHTSKGHEPNPQHDPKDWIRPKPRRSHSTARCQTRATRGLHQHGGQTPWFHQLWHRFHQQSRLLHKANRLSSHHGGNRGWSTFHVDRIPEQYWRRRRHLVRVHDVLHRTVLQNRQPYKPGDKYPKARHSGSVPLQNSSETNSNTHGELLEKPATGSPILRRQGHIY